MLRVAISTVGRVADDHRVWSGTPAGFVAALRARDDVEVVLLPPPAPRLHWLGRFASFVSKRAPGDRKVMWETEPAIVAAMTKAMLRVGHERGEVDAIIAVGWMPLVPSSHTPPVVCFNDSTYAQRVDASPHWSHLSRRTRRRLEEVEGRLLRSVDHVVMASRWAANDARTRYGLDPARTHVVPIGANISAPQRVDRAAPDPARIRLLATGVEWQRKGMDIAVRTAEALRARGVDARLDVVGVEPPDDTWRREYVTYHGFLRKSDAGEAARLNDLYRSADVFVFPTRDEPYGVVPAEAAAFSLPVVAPRHNALPEIVEDGVTGILVPAGADADAYADAAIAITSDPRRYEQMSSAGRDAFESRLTWDRSAARFVELLRGE